MATQVIHLHTRRRQSSQAWDQAATRFNLFMVFTVAILVPVEIVLAKAVQLNGLRNLLGNWPGLLALIAVWSFCRWFHVPRLIDLAESAVWAVLLTNTLPLLILVAGRNNRQLQDSALAAADTWMHFNTAYFVDLAAQLPALHIAATVAYASLPWLLLAAILLPPLCGHARASRRFILGIVFSAVITAALFALWPASGPWTTQNFLPTSDQAAASAYLALLNSQAPVTIDMHNAGIVSFPSYHVVLAILSALALGSVRPLRPAAWVLAILICASTVLTGWHYGIDLIGGLLVAIISVTAVNSIAI